MRYYHKFVENYGKIVAPLTILLKNNSFSWIPTTDQSFQSLKEVMFTTLVLSLPEFTKTFVLECDASGRGTKGVFMPNGWPLAFTNKRLSEWNLVQSIYEKEMFYILHTVNLGSPYLLGQCIQTKMDHQSLKCFLQQWISSPGKQKWVTKLFGYDYEIIYKGKENVVVDALSKKNEDEGSLFSLSFIVIDWLQAICQEWLQDPKVSSLIQKLQQDPQVARGYSWYIEEFNNKGFLYLTKHVWNRTSPPLWPNVISINAIRVRL